MARSSHANGFSPFSSQLGRPALDSLVPPVYEQLHALAKDHMRRESPGHTLQTTALIHEAYLRLAEQQSARWQSRTQFLAVAAEAMRRVLVDSARRHSRSKRGGDRARLPLHEAVVLTEAPRVDLLALDEALMELADIAPDDALVVQLRFFGGLTVDQTAEALGISTRTVERNWRSARAWLYGRLTKGDSQFT